MTNKSDMSYSQLLHRAIRRGHFGLALRLVTMFYYGIITEARKERFDRHYKQMESRAVKTYLKLQSDPRLK